MRRVNMKVIDGVAEGISLSIGIAVLLTVAVVSYGVLAREVLKLSDVWVTEVTTYLMTYITFVGTAALMWRGRHLKVDVIGAHLSGRGKAVLGTISWLIVTCAASVLFWLAISFWFDAWTSGEKSWGMFSIPLWLPYLSLLVGTGLVVAAQLARGLQNWLNWRVAASGEAAV